MSSILKNSIDIRPGEGRRVGIMASYLFVVVASYYILKPVTRSLFVMNLGPGELPILYMILALVVGIFILFYLNLSSKLRLDRLIYYTNFVFIINLLVFRWLLHINMEARWLYYTLFIWTSIYGVLTTTQFWLLANYLFNVREAKRLFAILTAAAILGGIVGGYLTSFFVNSVGETKDLIFFCIGFLLITTVLMKLAWQIRDRSIDRGRRVQTTPEDRSPIKLFGEVAALIRNSKHLALLIGVVSVTLIVVQIAEFQFVTFAYEMNDQTDALTAFLGFWLSNMSVLALLFQVLIAGWIIKRFGVGITILFLPIALLFASFWVFLSYGLTSILTLKIGDGSFRHSINKVSMELFYLPLSTEVKKKTKAFVDMFVDRFGRGVAGLLLLIFYSWLGFSILQISIISIVLIALWLVLAAATYREYVNSFRTAIAKRQIDTELVSGSITDEATINSLVGSLSSDDERKVSYALKLLDSVQSIDLTSQLIPLLNHASKDVRLNAIKFLTTHSSNDIWSQVEPLLHDEDIEVRKQAILYYANQSGTSIEKTLAQWLRGTDDGLRGASLYYIAENPDLADKMLDAETLGSFLEKEPQLRLQLAHTLGILCEKTYDSLLEKLLDDPDDAVKIQAIESVGTAKVKKFIPLLIENLGERHFRQTAREALAAFDEEIIDVLSEHLNDEKQKKEIRLGIPKVMALIGSQRSVETLLSSLSQRDNVLRFEIIKAMNKLRARFSELDFDDRVDQALMDELNRYYHILQGLRFTGEGNDTKEADFRLLTKVLHERLDDHRDRIFRLLGLNYPPRDIYNAYAATTSENRTLRANAVEFLDNILSSNHKRFLFPIVEDLPLDQVLARVDGLFEMTFDSKEEALQSLIQDSDPWLRACTIFDIGRNGMAKQFRSSIELASKDENPLVRETVGVVRKQYS